MARAIMVLAAGLGTRLSPLTDERPKPLVWVGDRPALFHVIERVRGFGPIVVNAFHFADQVVAALAGTGVALSRETTLLGTAGGLAHAAALLGSGDVLVWNADVLVDLDAAEVFEHHERSGADATLVVRAGESSEVGAGNVGLDANGRVVRLRKETFAGGEVKGAEFLGVHIVGERLREGLPSSGCLVGDVYIPRGRQGARLVSYQTSLSFVDLGTLAAYLTANARVLTKLGITSMIRGQVAESVTIGEMVVVGEGARVEGEGKLERVVVWPGAIARAPLSDAVVTNARIVAIV